MLALINDLYRHQAWADRTLLKAVRGHEDAAHDAQLRELLHHIVAVQRFFLFVCQSEAFDATQEMHAPDSLEAVAERFRDTHALEEQWLARVQEADLQRSVEVPFFRGQEIRVWEAMLQVCLHSQGHRSQCLTRLRTLGGKVPTLDYILWTKDRPACEPAISNTASTSTAAPVGSDTNPNAERA